MDLGLTDGVQILLPFWCCPMSMFSWVCASH